MPTRDLHVPPGVQRRLIELEDAGCVFRGLRSRRAWLIEPDRILPPLVGGLVGPRRVGILSPIEMPPAASGRRCRFRRSWPSRRPARPASTASWPLHASCSVPAPMRC